MSVHHLFPSRAPQLGYAARIQSERKMEASRLIGFVHPAAEIWRERKVCHPNATHMMSAMGCPYLGFMYPILTFGGP
jgi:hypothetical protein